MLELLTRNIQVLKRALCSRSGENTARGWLQPPFPQAPPLPPPTPRFPRSRRPTVCEEGVRWRLLKYSELSFPTLSINYENTRERRAGPERPAPPAIVSPARVNFLLRALFAQGEIWASDMYFFQRRSHIHDRPVYTDIIHTSGPLSWENLYKEGLGL